MFTRKVKFFKEREEELEKAVKQFFFLHYPTYRKTEDGKGVMRSNYEDRQDIIKSIGEVEFYKNASFNYLHDVEIPPCFLWHFNLYLDLRSCASVSSMGDTILTWSDIKSYFDLKQIYISQFDLSYLLMIKRIAETQMAEMRKD